MNCTCKGHRCRDATKISRSNSGLYATIIEENELLNANKISDPDDCTTHSSCEVHRQKCQRFQGNSPVNNMSTLGKITPDLMHNRKKYEKIQQTDSFLSNEWQQEREDKHNEIRQIDQLDIRNNDTQKSLRERNIKVEGRFNTGHWSAEEHKRFLESLEKFPHGSNNRWRKVACFVGTRTIVQARTHAQKYSQKLEKQKKYKLKQLQQHHQQTNTLTSLLIARANNNPTKVQSNIPIPLCN